MRRRLSIVLVLAGLITGLVPAPVLAGQKGGGGGGVVPFGQGDCGSFIDHSVRLTGDVDCSGVSGDAITIDADGISIDLAGHTLVVADSYSGVYTDYHSGISVSGGTIEVSGQGIGVYAYNGSYHRVSALTVTGTGTSAGRGVFCYGATSMSVTGVTASYLGSGIESDLCTITVASSTLSDNDIGYYTYYDTRASASGLTVSRNRLGVYDSATTRFSLTRSLAEGNNFGFYLDPAGYGTVTVSGLVARHSSYTGTWDTSINAYDGIGFVLTTGYTYGAASNSITSSIASDNESYGFYLYYPGPTTFKGNSALANGRSGVSVSESYGYYGPVYGSNNVARDNFEYGFWSEYAVAGSGNRISGNDYDEYGCPGWTCTLSR